MKSRLKGMNVFAEVVSARSFSAAADKLGISKSLASREVSALERSLTVKGARRCIPLCGPNGSPPNLAAQQPGGPHLCRAARPGFGLR